MKNLVILSFGLLVLASGCKEQQAESNIPDVEQSVEVTAISIVNGLKKSGLSIEDITEVTADNDKNKLLGRPNQYISKAFFYDAAYSKDDEQLLDPVNTVEIFKNDADAKARKDYIEEVTKGVAFLSEYQVLSGNKLLRLNKALSPADAKKYETAFLAL